MRFAVMRAVLLGCSLSWVLPAHATRLPTYPIGGDPSEPSTTAWAVDRYPPRVFQNAGTLFDRSDVLRIGVDELDSLTNRPIGFQTPFYDLQGRKIATPGYTAPAAVSGWLYIPGSWSSTNASNPLLNRRSDLVMILTPQNNAQLCANPPGSDACFVYAAMGFTNANPVTPTGNGGQPRIRILNKNIAETWINLTQPIRYDAWNAMCMVYTGTSVQYFLNGEAVGTYAPFPTPPPGNGPVTNQRIVLVQNYNFGSTYSALWSDLEAGPSTDLEVVRSGPNVLAPGQTASYTVTVRNLGPSVANNVILEDASAPGISVQSVGPPCSGLPCNLGSLNVGQSITLTINYQANPGFTGNTVSRVRVRSDAVDCLVNNTTAAQQISVQAVTAIPIGQGPARWLLLVSMLLLGLWALSRPDRG